MMTRESSFFASRLQFWAFWVGCAAVAIGVLLHLPMYLMARSMQYHLAGMPMGGGMLFGMFLILAGFAGTAYGLMPRKAQVADEGEMARPEAAALGKAHWVQIAILSVALVIDVMKAASLGFVTPGMRAEYGLSFARVTQLPFVALLGTTVGSFIWGTLADFYGRRASILLAAVMFMGTSICGAMPSYGWNLFMCFLMGLGAGGMLPVTFALLAEIMPTRHRGWCLVLVGGIGSVGGYFATSELSAALQPTFGWRVMWLINMPIALILIAVSPLLQESARFLQSTGRAEEARATLARFGLQPQTAAARPHARDGVNAAADEPASPPVSFRSFWGLTTSLTITALCVGFVTFGVMLWLPGSLMREGRSVGAVSHLLAQSAFLAMPTVLLVTWMYAAWSSKRTLVFTVAIMAVGLTLLLLRGQLGLARLNGPVIPLTLLIVGTNGLISVLLPYAAENYPLQIRARATGWVAGFSKAGGLLAQVLGLVALTPSLGRAAGGAALTSVASILLLALLGKETQGKDLL